MKLRKKDFEVPKNFSIPPWIISPPSLENEKSQGRNYSEIRIYNVHSTIQKPKREALQRASREISESRDERTFGGVASFPYLRGRF